MLLSASPDTRLPPFNADYIDIQDVYVDVFYLAGDDLFVGLNLFVGVEWRETSSHLIDQHSKRPPVHRVIVALHSHTRTHRATQPPILSDDTRTHV